MNASIRPIVLAGLGAVALVFLFSNRQPLPVVFFGRSLPALPVAIWALAFGIVGVLSGMLFQILPRLGKGTRATDRPPATDDRPASGRSERRERPEIADKRAGWEAARTPDWGAPPTPAPPDEWNIEEPPEPQGAVDPERLRRPRPERAPVRPAPATPAPNDPDTDDPLDDFDFPDAGDTETGNNTGVVDASYRLIDPPYRTDDRSTDPEDNDRDSQNR